MVLCKQAIGVWMNPLAYGGHEEKGGVKTSGRPIGSPPSKPNTSTG